MQNDHLSKVCGRTQEAATKALKWIADETENGKVIAVREMLSRDLRRSANHAAMLARAVNRPMCVGLFGPSQAGKSYLAGGLARMGATPLKILFGSEDERDFLAEINPTGGTEATGIVTRFSIRPMRHPPGYPVSLRLLSETDIVKILGNSYFFDSDPRTLQPMSADKLAGVLDAARARAGSGGGMPAEQIWNLQEYFQKQFEHLSPMRALSGYWDEAEKLAPRLDPEGRTLLFSPLWGAYPELTELFRKLVTALAGLGFAADAFARIDALIPRRKSIIDVETLLGLNDPGADTLELSTLSGTRLTLTRPVATALTAELQLTIKERPWRFFEHTDLLDFPGARNRDLVDMPDFLATKTDALKQLVVRGKVAFLFDRYVAEQELTAMLLVLKPSNQDITSLAPLVGEWIQRTHGRTPQDRLKAAATLLFIVFGWFNEELKRKPGENSDWGERFQKRMTATFANFFSKSSDPWPDNWTPGTSFKNSFWLRDPQYSRETFDVDPADGQEKLKLSESERVAKLREGYLGVADIRRYFADAALAWDEAMKGDNGGVEHLANSLEPVCEPEMKRRQVAAQLDDLRREMRAKLEQFHVSDDLTRRRDERLAVMREVLGSLEIAADARTFARVLRLFQTDESLLADHLVRTSRKRATSPERPQTARPRASSRFASVTGGAAAAPAAPIRDRAAEQAQDMVDAWTLAIGQRAESERAARELHVPNEHMVEIVAELAGAARRLGLAQSIAASLRRFAFPEASEKVLQRNAVIGATEINHFVAGLGFAGLDPNDRPTRPGDDGSPQPLFAPRPYRSARIELGQVVRSPDEDLVADWGFGLLALAEANASSAEGLKIDIARNNALGEILKSLYDADDEEER